MTAGLLLLTFAIAADKPMAIQRLPDAADAQADALADVVSASVYDRPFFRYIWDPDAKPEYGKLISWTANWLSDTPVYRPKLIMGRTILYRIDLRRYALDERVLKVWLRTWEDFVFDPNFSLLITQDTLDLIFKATHKWPFGVLRVEGGKALVPCKSYVGRDGNKYSQKWVSVIRLPLDILDPVITAQLEHETVSIAPVVHWEYWTMRSLEAIKEEEPYTTIFGGLYYELAGVRTAKEAGKKKATDLDQLMEDLGIIDDADVTKFQAKFDRLGSDQRVAMIKSKVTGKERVVFLLPALKSVRYRSVVLLTQDRKDGKIDILSNPFKNLLTPRVDASEVYWNTPFGGQKKALFNGQGKRQDEVPPDVANDHNIPEPYTKRLTLGSCDACHLKSGNDGWMPIPNEVQAALHNRPAPDIQTDVGNRNALVQDTVNLLAQKYAGDADQLTSELRRGTIAAILRMTGPWKNDPDKTQTGTARMVANEYQDLRIRYRFSEVDPAKALREIGYKADDAVKALNMLLPPDVKSRNDFLQVVPEDVTLAQLKAGKSVNRYAWELSKGFAIGRARQSYQRMMMQGKN